MSGPGKVRNLLKPKHAKLIETELPILQSYNVQRCNFGDPKSTFLSHMRDRSTCMSTYSAVLCKKWSEYISESVKAHNH